MEGGNELQDTIEYFKTGINDTDLTFVKKMLETKNILSTKDVISKETIETYKNAFIKKFGNNIPHDIVNKFCGNIDLNTIFVVNNQDYDKVVSDMTVMDTDKTERGRYTSIPRVIFLKAPDDAIEENERKKLLFYTLTEELTHRFLDLRERTAKTEQEFYLRTAEKNLNYADEPQEQITHFMGIGILGNVFSNEDLTKYLTSTDWLLAYSGASRVAAIGWERILKGDWLTDPEIDHLLQKLKK